MTEIDRVYQNYVRERFPLPAEADVAALGARINVRFPPDYRKFLLRYNGGWFGDHSLALPDDVPGDCIDCLYGVAADHKTAELGRPSDMSLFDDNDPPEIVIIGRTVTNQLVVLGVHPETYGRIYFKTYRSRVSKTDQSWFHLDDSIDEFFERIDDSAEHGWSATHDRG